ncbi:MAG: hypothetical protein P8188_10080 [Gemmatimonadota bacterium]|jgi:hypothetical protein
MMRGSKIGILTAVAGLALGACAETSTLPKEDDLTRFEASQMASFLIGRSFAATGVDVNAQTVADPDVDRLPLALARVTFDERHTLTGECPLGGSVEVAQSVDGFVDDETYESEINAAQTLIFLECAGEGSSGDFTFTLNSSPDVMATLSIAQDAEGLSTGSGAVTGAVDWTAGDRFGRCEIDFQFSMEGSAGNASFSASGVICDISFSQTVAVTT